MNANGIRHVILSTWWERKNNRSVWVHWVITGLAAAIAMLLWIVAGRQDLTAAAAMGFSVFWVGNLALFWLSFSLNAIQLCAPQHAHLTPSAKKTIVAAYLLAWLVASLSTAGLFSIVFGHFLLQSLGVGAALLLVSITWGISNWLAWLLFASACCSIVPLAQFGASIGLLRGEPFAVAGAMLALALLLVATIRLAFGNRGDKSYKMQEKARLQREMFNSGAATANLATPNPLRRFSGEDWFYRRALERQRASMSAGTTATAGDLLRYGFGPGFGYAHIVFSWLFAAAFFAAARLVPVPLSLIVQAFTRQMGNGFFGLVTTILIASTSATALMTVHRTRREQALLRLLPHVPQGAALNATVTGILLRNFMTGLFVTCLGALLVSQLTFATDLASVGESVTFAALGALPIGVLLLRDYSRMKAPTLTGLAATVLGLLSTSVLGQVRQTGWPLWLQATVLAFAAACCLGAIHMRRRWLFRLPVALPAGRMAD